jgi:hypothetical protein
MMMDRMDLNSREALMAFAGWLTSRLEPVTFSSKHDAAIAADLVEAFAGSQELPVIRDDFKDRLRDYPGSPSSD